MDKRLRAFLEQNGLRKNASDRDGWKLLAQLRADGVEIPDYPDYDADHGNGVGDGSTGGGTSPPASAGRDDHHAPASPASPTSPAVPADPADPAAAAAGMSPQLQADMQRIAAEAQQAERNRIREITSRCRIAGLDDDFARSLVDSGAGLDVAAVKIFDALAARNTPVGAGAHTGNFEVGEEARDKFRAAAGDGLLLRSGIVIDHAAPGAADFRGRTIMDICRAALDHAGIDTRGLSRRQLVGRALTSGSTSDFPFLMSALVSKHLINAYNEWPATWRPFVAIVDAVDFKDIYGIKLSEAPDLAEMDENGEYQTANFLENQEKYAVVSKGRIISLTRQMIINDDLRAFTRIPTLFGAAARRMESAAVYGLINSNPVLNDGKALFATAHHNLAGTPAALGTTTLGVARAAMRKQTGLNGAHIDVTPAFLLTPVELETDAEVLLRSTALPDDNKSAGVYNPWAGKLTPISDPYLSDASATAFYILAHPNQVATIEAAYLEGEANPYVDQEIDFDSDALKIKVRHEFGAGVVDHVGIYKNAGA